MSTYVASRQVVMANTRTITTITDKVVVDGEYCAIIVPFAAWVGCPHSDRYLAMDRYTLKEYGYHYIDYYDYAIGEQVFGPKDFVQPERYYYPPDDADIPF